MKASEDIVRKEENAGNQHFLLFSRNNFNQSEKEFLFWSFILLPANAFNLDQSKFSKYVKG